MVVDGIKLSHKVDAIVFATGDGDFIPAVEYIKSQGCQVEAITFGRSASSRFRETVDDFIDMDENPSEYLLGYRTTRKSPTRRSTGKASSKSANKTKTNLKKQIQKVVGTETDEV